MTIYINAEDERQAREAEKKIIASSDDLETHNPFYHDFFIYYDRNVRLLGKIKADNLCLRAETIMLAQSDLVLNLSPVNLNPVCRLLNIPVYSSIENLFKDKTVPETATDANEEKETKKVWCFGCSLSSGSPGIADNCPNYNKEKCGEFSSFEKAFLGMNED